MNQSLKGIMFSSTVLVKKVADAMSAKTSIRLKPLKRTLFASFSSSNLPKIGTERAYQALGASLAISIYADK